MERRNLSLQSLNVIEMFETQPPAILSACRAALAGATEDMNFKVPRGCLRTGPIGTRSRIAKFSIGFD
jgi:hypothetical protein